MLDFLMDYIPESINSYFEGSAISEASALLVLFYGILSNTAFFGLAAADAFALYILPSIGE